MRSLGVLMVLSGAVLNLVLLVQSDVSLLMDSQFKMTMTMISTNPILFALSAVLFFGGFVLAVAGDRITLVADLNHKIRLHKISKNERKRQEALRKQSERLMK